MAKVKSGIGRDMSCPSDRGLSGGHKGTKEYQNKLQRLIQFFEGTAWLAGRATVAPALFVTRMHNYYHGGGEEDQREEAALELKRHKFAHEAALFLLSLSLPLSFSPGAMITDTERKISIKGGREGGAHLVVVA